MSGNFSELVFEQGEGRLLSFALGTKNLSIPILQAREVLDILEINMIPRVPEFIEGVINYRGRIIPVIDLRIRFGIQKKVRDEDSCMIVTEIDEVLTSIIVDELHGVIQIDPSEFEDSPALGEGIDASYIGGIINKESGLVLVLDLQSILDNKEIEKLKAIG